MHLTLFQFDYPLVSAQNSSYLAIFGDGTINGGANDPPGHLVKQYIPSLNFLVPLDIALPKCSPFNCRIKLVVFLNCSEIVIEKVKLLNSPLWTLEFALSRNILVKDATIEGDRRWPNGDGCDVVSSTNVSILRTRISTGDDCIDLSTHVLV